MARQLMSRIAEAPGFDTKTLQTVSGASHTMAIARINGFAVPPSTINVRVKFTGSPGEFRRKFVLYCDEERLRVMPVAVTGRVTE
jgi:hypothetical protein